MKVTLDDIIKRNEELELQYAKAIETITRLQNRIKKLEDENTKLRRQNDILILFCSLVIVSIALAYCSSNSSFLFIISSSVTFNPSLLVFNSLA